MNHILSNDQRGQELLVWLQNQNGVSPRSLAAISPVAGDASWRRYFRLPPAEATPSLIVMDAPPPEDCRPFVQIAQLLDRAGLRVPRIHAHDPARGFMLLQDLGDQTLLDLLRAAPAPGEPQEIERHYRGALRALVQLQKCPVGGLAALDQARMLQELELFYDWYLQDKGIDSALARKILAPIFELLTRALAAQPQVLVHRDYHSPNLLPGSAAEDYAPGIIDFQDALAGPISYDIASLALDARHDCDEALQLDLAIRYWEYARAAALPVPEDFAVFHQQYEWQSLQRNLRIMGVFTRLARRDGKQHYLAHMPRVAAYVRQVAGRYAVFHPVLRLLDQAEGVSSRDGYSF